MSCAPRWHETDKEWIRRQPHDDPGRYYDIGVGPVDKDPYFAYGGGAAGKIAAFQRDARSVAIAIQHMAGTLRKTIVTAEEINASFNRMSLPEPPKLVMSPANQPASKRGKRFQNPDYQSRQFKYSQKRKK